MAVHYRYLLTYWTHPSFLHRPNHLNSAAAQRNTLKYSPPQDSYRRGSPDNHYPVKIIQTEGMPKLKSPEGHKLSTKTINSTRNDPV
jgi:hypothetical protein